MAPLGILTLHFDRWRRSDSPGGRVGLPNAIRAPRMMDLDAVFGSHGFDVSAQSACFDIRGARAIRRSAQVFAF
jgi:hypothetical protein